MNDTERQDLRRRLAERVMGWEPFAAIHGKNKILYWVEPTLSPKVFICQTDWTPDLPTPQGLYQCFGEGGLVEKLIEKQFAFTVGDSIVHDRGFACSLMDRVTGKHYWADHHKYVNTAICLAADKAMEGK